MSNECLFCKIIKNEIPATKVFENDSVVGFVDIFPQAQIHRLFVHKNHTANINEMASNPAAIGEVFEAIAQYTQKEGLEQKGFRVVTNLGKHAGQTVFHTHFHVVGGEPLGRFGS